MDGLVLQSQSSFSLCRDPPSYNLEIKVNRMVVLNETLGKSNRIVLTPHFVANITVHQLESAIAIMVTLLIQTISMCTMYCLVVKPYSLLMQVQTFIGNNTSTLFNYTVLPYDPSLCPENISGSHFSCPPLSSSIPATNVHELKPSDVKVHVHKETWFNYIPCMYTFSGRGGMCSIVYTSRLTSNTFSKSSSCVLLVNMFV